MSAFRLAALFVALALCLSVAWIWPMISRPLSPFEVGRQWLDEGKPGLALHLFETPIWRGTAAYRAEHYAHAVGEFAKVTTPLGLYNLGTAHAKLGQFEEAAAAFDAVLRLEPEHVDARHNLDVVRRAVARLQEELDKGKSRRALSEDRSGLLERDPMAAETPDPARRETARGRASDRQGGRSDQGVISSQGVDGSSNRADARKAAMPGKVGEPAAEEDQGTVLERIAGAEAGRREDEQAAAIALGRIKDDPAKVLKARFEAAAGRAGQETAETPKADR